MDPCDATVADLHRRTVHCWVVSAQAASQHDAGLAAARSLLSDDERRRSDLFRFDRDRRLFIASHAALRHLLGRYTGMAARDIQIVEAPEGRPELDAKAGSRLRFNLSHSDSMALVALAWDEPVGVDIERVPDFDDIVELATHYFAPSERASLLPLPPAQQQRGFATTWTRKESVIKALGLGLRVPLDSFDTGAADGPPHLTGSDPCFAGWTLVDLDPAPGYVGCVAMPTLDVAVRMQDFSWSDLEPRLNRDTGLR